MAQIKSEDADDDKSTIEVRRDHHIKTRNTPSVNYDVKDYFDNKLLNFVVKDERDMDEGEDWEAEEESNATLKRKQSVARSSMQDIAIALSGTDDEIAGRPKKKQKQVKVDAKAITYNCDHTSLPKKPQTQSRYDWANVHARSLLKNLPYPAASLRDLRSSDYKKSIGLIHFLLTELEYHRDRARDLAKSGQAKGKKLAKLKDKDKVQVGSGSKPQEDLSRISNWDSRDTRPPVSVTTYPAQTETDTDTKIKGWLVNQLEDEKLKYESEKTLRESAQQEARDIKAELVSFKKEVLTARNDVEVLERRLEEAKEDVNLKASQSARLLERAEGNLKAAKTKNAHRVVRVEQENRKLTEALERGKIELRRQTEATQALQDENKSLHQMKDKHDAEVKGKDEIIQAQQKTLAEKQRIFREALTAVSSCATCGA